MSISQLIPQISPSGAKVELERKVGIVSTWVLVVSRRGEGDNAIEYKVGKDPVAFMRLRNQVCFQFLCCYLCKPRDNLWTSKLLLWSELSFGTYLIFWSIPVVDYACWDEKTVVHVAAATVIPPTVIAHLGFPIGKAYGSLASCSKQKKKSLWLGYTTLKLNKIPQQERNCREPTYRYVPSFLAWQLPPPCLLGETLKLVPFLVSSDSISSARNCQRSASPQPHFYSLLSSSETLFPQGTLLRLLIQDLIETTHLRGRCYQLYFADE